MHLSSNVGTIQDYQLQIYSLDPIGEITGLNSWSLHCVDQTAEFRIISTQSTDKHHFQTIKPSLTFQLQVCLSPSCSWPQLKELVNIPLPIFYCILSHTLFTVIIMRMVSSSLLNDMKFCCLGAAYHTRYFAMENNESLKTDRAAWPGTTAQFQRRNEP